MSKEKRLVPELRFPEFYGEWNINSLSNLSYINPKNNGLPKEFYYLDLESVDKGIVKSWNLIEKINAPSRAQRLLHVGDIIFQTVRPYQMNNYHYLMKKDYPVISSTGYAQVRAKGNGKFLYYSLHTRKFVSNVLNRCTGTSYPAISSSDLGEIEICYPSIIEQKKIASFLSLIDKKIELLEKKVKLLEEQKRGLLQKIFSQEIRFKKDDGSDFEEWHLIDLKNILSEYNNRTTKNNQFRVLSSTNSGLYLQSDYFNRSIASADDTGYKILKRGQIVFSPQNLWMGNLNFNDKFDIGIVSPSYKIFDIRDNYNSVFISYLMKTRRAFYNYRLSSEQGASVVRRNLNFDLFLNIVFKIPVVEEQKEIADFLSKCDLLIGNTKIKLENIRKMKKGLLQKMFI